MSDDPYLHPLANFAPADLERLTPSERETMNGLLSRAGFKETLPEPVAKADRIAKEFHGELAKQNASATPQETPAVGQSNVFEKYSLTAPELVSGAAVLRKFGSPEILAQLDKMEIGEPAIEPTAAERSADNISEAYSPGAKPSDYKLKFPADIEASEVVKLNTEITGAFHAASVPLANAQGLADSMADSAKAIATMNEAQKELHAREVLYSAEKLVGQEGLERAAAVAKTLGPSYEKWKANGCFASVATIVQLSAIGEAVAYRALRAKEKAGGK
jgi:hypothetical protein